MPTIGQRIADLLERHHWSLGVLAARSGVSRSYLSLLTRDRIPNPGAETIRKIAAALGVSIEDLADERPAPPRVQRLHGVVFVPIVQRVRGLGGELSWADTRGVVPMAEQDAARHAALLAVTVHDAGMAPEVQPGDTVIFDPTARAPEDGALVVVTVGAEPRVLRAYHEPDGRLVFLADDGQSFAPDQALLEGAVVQLTRRPTRRPRRP
jgi:transcriptional regulator with XRE-family HTH domain